MGLLLRTTENAMPAITTELDFTTEDLLEYMLSKGLFVNLNGTTAQDRVEAAKAYLQTDWHALREERWAHPGFDPEKPYLEEEEPDWRDTDPVRAANLQHYLELKDAVVEQMEVIKSGPNDEYERAENSLLMRQRVDLWCAGEAEVEKALKHLVALGRRYNSLEPDLPIYVTEFWPGADPL